MKPVGRASRGRKNIGGRGATLMEQVIFTEEMAKAGAPPLANVLGLALIGPTIIDFGTDAQKKRYLANILSGDEIWCQGFSEPNAGSDLAGLRTEARLEGDHYIVNGQKIWNSYGWAADWCALVTRSDPGSQKHKGLSYLLVDMKSPGVEVRPLRQMTGEAEFTELFFRDVRFRRKTSWAPRATDGTWRWERWRMSARRWAFGAQIAMRGRSTGWSSYRHRDATATPPRGSAGRAKNWRNRYIENEVMRLNQMRAVSRIIQTGAPGPEGSILKLAWSEANQRFQIVAQEILGPIRPDHRAATRPSTTAPSLTPTCATRGNTIEAGTSEMQRNIIGQHVLGLPKSY